MNYYFEVMNDELSSDVKSFMKNDWKRINQQMFDFDFQLSEWKTPMTILAYTNNNDKYQSELIGVASCNIIGKTLRLSQLIIKINYRKKYGLGSKILKELEKQCRLNEWHKIQLSTSENHKNLEFHQKNGFKIEATL